MSNYAALEAPNEFNKPWAKFYLDTLTAKVVNISQSMTISDLEVKNNLLVDGYINSKSNQETCGSLFLTTFYPQAVAVPVGTNGIPSAFSSSLGKVILSDIAGVNTACASTDGTTFAQLLTPFNNPGIAWSPTLALFSGLDSAGTATYTSPTAVNGTWGLGTPLAGATYNGGPFWIDAFAKFFVNTAGVPTQQIATSSNGSLYSLIPATRDVFDLAYSPELARLVSVGNNGPMYTDDGKAFANSNSVTPMSSVCWSSFWGKYVAVPRGGVLTTVHQSVDGINWTSVLNAFDAAVGNLRSVLFINALQLFIAQGDVNIYTSKDGIQWRKSFNAVPAGMDIYGARYIEEWGELVSGGIGGFAAVTPRRYAF